MYDGPIHLQVACANLRHKMMYIDDRQRQVGMVDDSSDTRVFWCIRTQESLGPDGENVNARRCTPERGCYCKS